MLLAAAALSDEPSGDVAARAAVAAACDELAAAPATVVLFATAAHDPRPLVAAARAAAPGARVVGCAASGVLVGGREVEDGPAVAAMALAGVGLEPFLAGAAAEVRPPAGGGLALLFADGYTGHPDPLAQDLGAAWTGCVTAGALATGPDGVFPAHRWLDDEISATGIAGLFLGAPALVAVTQGCRPVGPVHTVTRADGLVIAEIDDRAAFAVFAERARPLLHDLARAAQTLFLAVDGDLEHEYVVRGVLQFDPERGLLATSSPIPVGGRFRFAVRDAWSARADLRRVAADMARRLEGRRPRAGFYFDSAGRGRGLFGVEDHDVAYLRSALGDFPLAGIFGGGEIGPAAGRTRLHLFAGILAVVP